MKKWILIGIAAVFIVLIFFSGFFIKKNYLTATVFYLGRVFKTDLAKENISLKLENENLKAQIQKFQFLDPQGEKNAKYLSASVFSTYPLNVKDVLVVNKGSSDGVSVGAPVMQGGEIFLGVISEVSKNFLIVKTVFNPGWQLSVKIGENKINGLFTGGNEPKIELIEKPVRSGEPVFISSKDFPLGLKIGEIGQIKENSDGVFKQATVKIPYSISEIDEVKILK